MKNILITGKESYIGTSVEKWLMQWPSEYQVFTLDVKREEWKKHDFSKYDVVFHVAGIAHVSKDHSLDELYYRVNRDLAVETAQKAKKEGVKQFLFMSSGILYGINEPVGKKVMIGKDTIPYPFTAYGESKLQADFAISGMDSEDFRTVCIRTPMVYGKGCKGNFRLLSRYAEWLFILPDITNCRSMIHIENLSNFVKRRIDEGDGGIFWPQNAEYVSTNQIVEEIRRLYGKKTYYSRVLAVLVKGLSGKVSLLRKMYGDLAYGRELSSSEYIVNDFKESILRSISSRKG